MKTSIFCLEEIRCDDEVEQDYLEAYRRVMGYYSSLGKALSAMKKNTVKAYCPEEIYAYLIGEIPVDGEMGDSDWLSVRSYDPSGKLLEECLHDYNLVNKFEGRNKADIHFNIGDIVEALYGERIEFGIVAALPPTPEDGFKTLDALDDSYLILPLVTDYDDHIHVAPTYVFALRHVLPEEKCEYLRNMLKIWLGKKVVIQ